MGAFLIRDWPGRALVGVATLDTKAGHHVRAAELLGLVLRHPAANEEDK
jgi:hypothetical protein